MLPAEDAIVTVKVKGTVLPAGTAARAIALDPAKLASVPEKTEVEPCVIVRFIFEQKSVAEPFTEPLFDCVHAAPGVRLKLDAATVPVFLIVMLVATDEPGTKVVEPPNLLIDEQVAEFEETVVPSVEVQVTVAPAFCSCIVSAPDAAVLVEFVIAAVNPDRVPVSESDRSVALSTPEAMVSGTKRARRMAGMETVLCRRTGVREWVCVDDRSVRRSTQSPELVTVRCAARIEYWGSPYGARNGRRGHAAGPIDPGGAPPRRRTRPEPPVRGLLAALFQFQLAQRRVASDLQHQTGLAESDLVALGLLIGGEPTPVKDLSRALGLTAGSTSTLVDRLVRTGMAQRTPSLEDRRVMFISITPAGAEVMDSAEHRFRYAIATALRTATNDCLDTTTRVLEEIARTLVAGRPGAVGPEVDAIAGAIAADPRSAVAANRAAVPQS